MADRTHIAENAPVCGFCKEPLGGGPGGWFSLVTMLEVCNIGIEDSWFHEPANGVQSERTQADG